MRVLLPFFDDSTLFFAATMRRILSQRHHEVTPLLISENEKHTLSDRQLRAQLNDSPVKSVSDIMAYIDNSDYDAVILAKAPPSIRRSLSNFGYHRNRKRPCFVAFQPGLEFTPARGFANRCNFDVVFLNNVDHVNLFRRRASTKHGQHVSHGHPYFLGPDTQRQVPQKGDIVFFAQAICPSTLRSRIHMLDVLLAMARAHRDQRVVLKLRHLPGENGNHVHAETFSYPDLLDRYFPDKKEMLAVTAAPMHEVLDTASYCITCTSTAAMDAISANVPTAIYTDYVEHYVDKYVPAMRREFEDSGLITRLDDLLNLRFQRPMESWLARRFRGQDLFDEMEAAIASFRSER